MALVPTLAFKSNSLVVIDDFSTADVLDAISAFFKQQEFEQIGQGKVLNKVWHLSDGPSYYSQRLIRYDLRTRALVNDALETFMQGTDESLVARYLATIAAVMGEHTDVMSVGKASFLSAKGTRYPANSGLRIHNDAYMFGSFTHYNHIDWHPDWGGELLVYDSEIGNVHPMLSEAAFDNTGISSLISKLPPAIAISPKPNRLVLMGSARLHKIARISARAGDNIRSSVQGFLL